MPTTVDIPPTLLRSGPGTVAVDASGFGVRIYVRESPEYITRYNRSYQPFIKLPSWDCDPMCLIAFLLRIGERPEMTYQTWLEPHTVAGYRCLRQLAEEKRLLIHIVTTEIARTYRTENTIRDKAAFLADALQQVPWDLNKLEYARRRIDTLYPTASRLWSACLRAERVSRNERSCGSLVS